MDHEGAIALLEAAAVEPDGFERLAAGDTPESAALAGHLAGCPSCTAAFEDLGRTAARLRTTIRAMPPADLRARTLALVAAAGRPRGRAAAEATAPGRGLTPVAVMPAPRSTRAVRRWMTVAAAAVIVAGIGVAGWWAASSALDAEREITEQLSNVTATALRVGSQPDARLIPLSSTTGTGSPKGELTFSPNAEELVVVAEGLDEPSSGDQYRCWMEIDGDRQVIGPMHHGGGLAYWAGWSDLVRDVPPESRFGVSLVSADGDAAPAPVLVGEL
jgi:hypothetical protein